MLFRNRRGLSRAVHGQEKGFILQGNFIYLTVMNLRLQRPPDRFTVVFRKELFVLRTASLFCVISDCMVMEKGPTGGKLKLRASCFCDDVWKCGKWTYQLGHRQLGDINGSCAVCADYKQKKFHFTICSSFPRSTTFSSPRI